MRLADWDGGPPGWSGMVPLDPGDLDADGDGTPDTLVVDRDDGGAWVFTDLDADGSADQVLDLDPVTADGDPADVPVLGALIRLVTGG